MSESTAAAPAPSQEALDAIAAQGNVVRELKAAKADAGEIEAAVKKLIQLKVSAGMDMSGNKKKKAKKPKDDSRDQAKKQRKQRRQQQQAVAVAVQETAHTPAVEGEPTKNYGDYPMIQSTERTGRVWTDVKDLAPEMDGQSVWVRGRVHNVRSKGKMAFMVIRDSLATVQGVAFADGTFVDKTMVRYLAAIPKESIVDVYGLVTVPQKPVDGTTQAVELSVQKVAVVSRAENILPLQVEDCSRPEKEGEEDAATVAQHQRLNYRWIDLRTPTSQGIMRLSSMTGLLFRECLLNKGFTEIHSPKLIAAASEGGAEVFKLNYFGGNAYLAQSPQLYKQMSLVSDLGKVFEIGPVFRAENSQTHRHLTEFTGMDMEMAFKEHYHEVLDTIGEVFTYVLEGLKERCQPEMAAIQKQFPFEPVVVRKPYLRLEYPQAVAMLREHGVEMGDFDDLNTEMERTLGRLVKAKYETDFFILDKFPAAIRPFYTMPDPTDPNYTNSYDAFLRGEEICSGAQRIHDSAVLETKVKALGIPADDIASYISCFRHGAPPHAGMGVGMERVVMLFAQLKNIRQVSLFPRDPKRLTP